MICQIAEISGYSLAPDISYGSPFYLFCRRVLRIPAADFSSTSKK